jgi:hypothetical protein
MAHPETEASATVVRYFKHMIVEVWKMTLGISLGFNHQVTGEAD